MSNKMKKTKKAELTTQQIVTLIILIVSFGVILFLFFRLNLGEVSDSEICHNSVVLKGKSSLGGSLNCKTSYVCISGGGDCKGINPTKTIEIDLDIETAKNETMKTIADEMANCWWMFGEGKVDYEGEDWKGYHCAVCSVIKFDNSFSEVDLKYSELYDYLTASKRDETQTYLNYLYGVNKISLLKDIKIELDLDKEDIVTTEKYNVITGLNPDWPSDDSVIHSYLIKSSEVNSRTSCDVFDITKA